MSFLPKEFTSFIAPSCDRLSFLQKYLQKNNIPFTLIPIENCTHIVLRFPPSSYDVSCRVKTFIAHYDRALGSDGEYITPGANDNSAAVFQLIHFAKKLLHSPQKYTNSLYNVRIIFTDGEELGSVQEQGSFALANLFRKLNIVHDDVFVLDGCGRGDVLSVSTVGKSKKASKDFLQKYDELFIRTCEFVKEASRGRWSTIPVPYSDNAAFIANGIPAMALTVLPSDENADYMRNLQKDKKLLKYIVSNGDMVHRSHFLSGTSSSEMLDLLKKTNINPAEALLMNEKLPKTWRMMHTEFDNSAQLTKEAFVIMERFLDLLANSQKMI